VCFGFFYCILYFGGYIVGFLLIILFEVFFGEVWFGDMQIG